MLTVTAAEARERLTELLDEVEKTHERVVITVQGRDSAVIISAEELESLEESLDILGNRELMQQIAESREDLATGDVWDAEATAALMAERRDRPHEET